MTDHDDVIDVAALTPLISGGNCRVVDCRFNLLQPEEGLADFRAGHIPGAVYADLNQDLAAEKSATTGRHPLPDVADFVARLEKWGIANDTHVVAYDDASGALAARLWWMLKWLGHEPVSVLDGGFRAWFSADNDIEMHAQQYSPTQFVARPDDAMVTTTPQIAAQVKSRELFNLLDARDHARFVGQTEPIDAVAGHIPGATNLPFTSHLEADGTWRARADIAESWQSVLDERDGELPVTVMCGSGVTACHLALSAVRAGLEMPQIYIGSWSEWICDGDRPVAAGDMARPA